MKNDLNLKQIVDMSPTGKVNIPKNLYIFLPDKAYKQNTNGKIYRTDYMCSLVESITKYDNNSINIGLVDLPKAYNGEKINLIDSDEYSWRFMNTHPVNLEYYKTSLSWRNFK